MVASLTLSSKDIGIFLLVSSLILLVSLVIAWRMRTAKSGELADPGRNQRVLPFLVLLYGVAGVVNLALGGVAIAIGWFVFFLLAVIALVIQNRRDS